MKLRKILGYSIFYSMIWAFSALSVFDPNVTFWELLILMHGTLIICFLFGKLIMFALVLIEE